MSQDNHHQKNNHHGQGFSIDEQQAGFMLGAVVGAVVGGAAALLLSPKNGKEMREIVKKYSKDLESEAYELAKESRGVAKSFKTVLEEGAVEVMEQAPEKIEQASQQAQQLAGDLSERFESARDVVAELAEAFRSGWEEYGEDVAGDEEVEVATPILFEAEDSTDESDTQAEPEEVEEIIPHSPSYGRRRTHGASAYSMHTANEPIAVAEPEVEHKEKEIEVKKVEKEEKVEEVKEPKAKTTRKAYTTRVVEEPRKVETKSKLKTSVDDSESKTSATPKKKLLFRRSSK